MLTLIKNAYVYRNDSCELRPLEILCEDGHIIAIEEKIKETPESVFNADGMAVFPGLVDVHTHGRSGYDFVSCKAEQLGVMARDYASRGVTTVMPALASAPLTQMLASAQNIADFVPKDDQAELCGAHLEGRYLNLKKRGAHAENMLAPLKADELDDQAFRSLKALHVSAAFELDCDGSFAKKAKEMGATLGLGHTAATFDEAKKAESMGVTSYTHLFNAMPPLHHRDGGAVAACLLGDSYAEIICDGVHIAPEMVELAYKCKGERKLSLISDSMEATGCPDGEYSIAGNPVTVKNGKALTHDGALAGSTLTLDTAVQNLVRFCSVPLTKAILCATEVPAKQMGIFDSCGSIDIGKRADMLFCDMNDVAANDFKIKTIMLRGNFIK